MGQHFITDATWQQEAPLLWRAQRVRRV